MASKVAPGAPSGSAQKAKRTDANGSAPTKGVQKDGEEKIRCLAYEKWLAAGQPAGDGIDFWLEAERECNKNG